MCIYCKNTSFDVFAEKCAIEVFRTFSCLLDPFNVVGNVCRRECQRPPEETLIRFAGPQSSLPAMSHMVRKKIDSRIRTLIENGVQERHRTFFVIVGDRGKDQVRLGASVQHRLDLALNFLLFLLLVSLLDSF